MQRLLKKIGIAVMVLSAFTLSSCDELKDLLKFDFDLEGEAVYIEVKAPIHAGEVKELGSESYERSLADILKEEAPEADISKIREINLTGITLEILEPSEPAHSFKNLDNILIEISAEGIDELMVGSLSSIPTSATTTLVIPVSGGKVNIKDYMSKRNFKYAVKGMLKENITKTFTIKVTASYSFVFGV